MAEGPAGDDFESSRIEWIPLADVRKLITKQDIPGASTVAALLLLITEDPKSLA